MTDRPDNEIYRNLLMLENLVWLLTEKVHVANYDFSFEQFFSCQHPWQLPEAITAIARIGAPNNYAELYNLLLAKKVSLIHTPDEHQRCSELPAWYPLLSDMTPRSIWFHHKPTPDEIIREFQFPIFLKGARQTSKHNKKLSVINDLQALTEVLAAYDNDPVLRWQPVVCREYVDLRPVAGDQPDKIPASFEFRTFWWSDELVGAGRYWFEASPYNWTASEEAEAITIAGEAAKRLHIPFLVVDVAQQLDGKWIVIECNDGQESGYAGISPFRLWRNILNIERRQR